MANGGYILIRGPRSSKPPLREPPKRWKRSRQDREKIARNMSEAYSAGLRMSKEEKVNRMRAMKGSPFMGNNDANE